MQSNFFLRNLQSSFTIQANKKNYLLASEENEESKKPTEPSVTFSLKTVYFIGLLTPSCGLTVTFTKKRTF